MPFQAKQYGNQWFVRDTDDGVKYGPYDGEKSAKAIAQKLTDNPPNNNPKEKWIAMTAQNQNDQKELLAEGFEPYAVWDGIVYFKKPKIGL